MTRLPAEPHGLGARVRGLRRQRKLTQVRLAEELGISPTYLNLIEHGRRPLTAPLLLKLAQALELDLDAFMAEGGGELERELVECLGDPLFDRHRIVSQEARELARSAPALARGFVDLYRAWRSTREAVETLGARLSGDDGVGGADVPRLPNEEVNDFLQRHFNYFPSLEETAERIWESGALQASDLFRSLAAFLADRAGVSLRVVRLSENGGALRRYDPATRTLTLAEMLAPRSRNFHLAHQAGLLLLRDELDHLVEHPQLSSEESRALARVVLANYFAGALLMPYGRFVEAVEQERYDVEVLGHRFRTSFEQVCHRLTTLRRPGAEGVPFHMVRVDIAGNLSKRFTASGMQFARFSGGCPRWNVHAAFLTPGTIRVQLSSMPDGTAYFEFARVVRKDRGSYHEPETLHAVGMGCELRHAPKLVYADGVDLQHLATAVPIGITCRVCERTDCQQRAFPPLQERLRLNLNERGMSAYSPPARGAE